MLRIEEIVGNVDDDFRDYLLEMDDAKLHALLADSQTLRHLLPMGVSYREAVTVINAILEYRAQPPEETRPPPPVKKARAPRKKKTTPPPLEALTDPVPEATPPPPPPAEEAPEPKPPSPPLPEGEGRGEGKAPRPLDSLPEPAPPMSLPRLKPRLRDHVILVLPVMLAAALVILLLSR
jgi:hypothetical protein